MKALSTFRAEQNRQHESKCFCRSLFPVRLCSSGFSELSAIEAETDRINSEIAAAGGDVDPKLIERQHALNEKYWADGGSTYRARTRSTLLGLGFTEDELSRSINSFSGGQRNKAQLAKLLLSDANLLLLDEPTNHLDISAIEWLENFLSAYRGSFIVISHDRYFLDKVTNRTMELKDRRLFISKGNYSRHLELRSTARELEMRQYLRTKKKSSASKASLSSSGVGDRSEILLPPHQNRSRRTG